MVDVVSLKKYFHILALDDVSISFGGLKALDYFHLELHSKELLGLIGPNGAGKTTVFNIVTGIYRPSRGKVYFENRDITHMQPHRITQLGVARTFQNVRLFSDLSVLDNVKIAYHYHVGYGILSSVLRRRIFRAEERTIEERALKFLDIFRLAERKDELAKNLPYGDQRRLEIARALATEPRLLILDEPVAGMNPQESVELMELLRNLRDEFDLTILLIEHDMHFVMNICERIVVLDYGKIIAEGKPMEIKNNRAVIKAYLGEGI
jgi:branched-chain amino acid transport system ATP-binding protein